MANGPRALAGGDRVLVERRAVNAIVQRARAIAAGLPRPERRHAAPLPQPGGLDLDATMAVDPPWRAHAIRVETRRVAPAQIVLALDLSLSMRGPEIAELIVAAMAVCIRLPQAAVLVFDHESRVICQTARALPLISLARALLRAPRPGLTDVGAGLRAAAELLQRRPGSRPSVVLMTDGVANTGGDPLQAARALRRLHVVQIGRRDPWATRACLRWAKAGRGSHHHAADTKSLPTVLGPLMRACLRG